MKLREIERLRAIAVLMVMAVHGFIDPAWLPDVARESWSGVDLFFVISGYVVTLSLVRLLPPLDEDTSFTASFDHARQALKTFYVRRFFRIMPAALTVMLLHGALSVVLPGAFGSTVDWSQEFFAFFGGVYNYARVAHDGWHMGVYWSLAVEEHFYLMLPMMFVLLRTTDRRLAGCAVVAVASIAARNASKDGIPPEQLVNYLKFASHLRFDSLMAGVALALVSGRGATPPILPRWLLRWFLLPVAIAVVWCLPGAVPVGIMVRVGVIGLWMISGLLVAYAGLDRGYVLEIPGLGRLLEVVGARSYSLYLVHVTAGRLSGVLLDRAGAHPVWLVALLRRVAILVLAELLFRIVEKPMMRVGRRLIDRA